MNKVILMGRLTRDPDVRYSGAGNQTIVARFSLAVDRRFKKEGSDETADFISCVTFGKTAEFMEKYVQKGTKLVVEGRIQTGSYTNKEGQKVYTTDVIVENAEFAESKAAASGSGYKAQDIPEPVNAIGNDFMNIPDGVEDEGLPFN